MVHVTFEVSFRLLPLSKLLSSLSPSLPVFHLSFTHSLSLTQYHVLLFIIYLPFVLSLFPAKNLPLSLSLSLSSCYSHFLPFLYSPHSLIFTSSTLSAIITSSPSLSLSPSSSLFCFRQVTQQRQLSVSDSVSVRILNMFKSNNQQLSVSVSLYL